MAVFTATYTVNCPACKGDRVIKVGKRRGQQRYLCQRCSKKFRANGKAEGRRLTAKQLGGAVRDYYAGLSFKQISEGMAAKYNIPKPSKSTAYRWIREFTSHASDMLRNHRATTGDVWVADELVVDVGGEKYWLWNIMDRKTRFILASHLSKRRDLDAARTVLWKAIVKANGKPRAIITDGLRSYNQPIKQMLPRAEHRISKGIKKFPNNNFSERLQGTYRSRIKTLRGLESRETGQQYLDGWTITYNHFREHEGIGFQRPGDLAKVGSPFREWDDVVRSAVKKTVPPRPVLPGQRTLDQYKQSLPARLQGMRPRVRNKQRRANLGEPRQGGQKQLDLYNTSRSKTAANGNLRSRHTKVGAPRPVMPRQGEFQFKPSPHPALAAVDKVVPRRLKPRVRIV